MAIQRNTFFRVLDPANIPLLVQQYDIVRETAQKDGKPYLLSLEASGTIENPLSQGYNFKATTTFATLEDLKYYDTQCAAHLALKKWNVGKVEVPPLSIWVQV